MHEQEEQQALGVAASSGREAWHLELWDFEKRVLRVWL
jgi:hypothetical protein